MQPFAEQPDRAKHGSSSNAPALLARKLLSHHITRQVVLPVTLVALTALLTLPLLNDLRLLSEGDFTAIEQGSTAREHDGNLMVHVKDINPNNSMATLDVTYVTENLGLEKVELWIASGGVTCRSGRLVYDKDTDLHRVPVVMDSPSIFVLGETKRATYKQPNVEIKIEQRTQGYFCPFDRYALELSFVLTDKSAKPLHPKLWCELDDSHFVHAAPRPLVSHGERVVSVPNSVAVVLQRPMYVKVFLVLSLLMGLGCVLWTLYKITYTSITAMESFSLLAFDFTVLMAVPALRSVFVPSNLQFAPLFDFFVVLIWTAGVLALVVNIFRHDFMVRTRQAGSNDGRSSPALFVGDRRDPANATQSIMSRRAG